MELLDLKGSGASKLLSNLVQADIIESVSGYGKGKYKFKIQLVQITLKRKLNRQRSVFPSDTALYLATFEATKKWTATIRNWAQVYGELSIMYEGRLPNVSAK